MNDATALLHCPNFTCQTPNLETQHVCRQCQTPLPRRYLWVAGAGLLEYLVGSLVGDRYLLKSPRVVLDTKPGLPPVSPAEIPDFVTPYLRLFPQRLHLPQPYSLLPIETTPATPSVLLLEGAPLSVTAAWMNQTLAASNVPPEPLLPSLNQSWHQTTAFRQLNWLWQIAQLWQPLSREGVAASLLNPQLLRVEGPLLRLLELEGTRAASLVQLGKLWSTWVTEAQPEIAPLLEQLSQQLQQEYLATPEALQAHLEQAIQVLGQTQICQVHLATRTDQGPSRQRNEDACYPPSGTRVDLTLTPNSSDQTPTNALTLALTLVCDGIGGHEGGDIASNLAIQSIQQQLQTPSAYPTHQGLALLTTQLEQAVCLANDAISQRNDGERRQERQRMGTTLVMALASAHEIYITHVGDSRVYWITQFGCHQVTLDDDLASREVRLGYTFYRDALELSTNGSLVQALGMSHSANLHPTVQRLLLDEESVFLLCSDGLSDHDRVEESWEAEILPILQGKVDVETASQRLIEVANRKNGHDNATVSLLHCQPQPLRPLNQVEINTLLTPPAKDFQEQQSGSLSRMRTGIVLSPQTSGKRWLRLAFIILPLLSIGSALLYWLIWSSNHLSNPATNPASPSPLAVDPPSVIPDLSTPTPGTVGALVQLTQPTSLSLQPGEGQQRSVLPTIPRGAILQLMSRQELPAQGYWLKLKICTLPSAPQASLATLPQSGTTGWIQEQALSAVVLPLASGSPSSLENCQTGAIAPSPATGPAPPSP